MHTFLSAGEDSIFLDNGDYPHYPNIEHTRKIWTHYLPSDKYCEGDYFQRPASTQETIFLEYGVSGLLFCSIDSMLWKNKVIKKEYDGTYNFQYLKDVMGNRMDSIYYESNGAMREDYTGESYNYAGDYFIYRDGKKIIMKFPNEIYPLNEYSIESSHNVEGRTERKITFMNKDSIVFYYDTIIQQYSGNTFVYSERKSGSWGFMIQKSYFVSGKPKRMTYTDSDLLEHDTAFYENGKIQRITISGPINGNWEKEFTQKQLKLFKQGGGELSDLLMYDREFDPKGN